MTTELRGRYHLVQDVYLREKASGRSCPVDVFYEAMPTSVNCEDYFAKVGQIEVNKPGFKENPVTARDEILYARQNKRIVDG